MSLCKISVPFKHTVAGFARLRHQFKNDRATGDEKICPKAEPIGWENAPSAHAFFLFTVPGRASTQVARRPIEEFAPR
nr:hypothetical protein [Kosakonia arachidis]